MMPSVETEIKGADAPPGRKAHAEKKRAGIAQASLAEFRQHGYAGASVDAIATRARVSKPTIYRYFGSKEQLFLTVIGDQLAAAYTHLPALAPNVTAAQDVRDGLILFLRAWVDTALDRSVLDLRRLVIGEVERFPELGERWAEINSRMGDEPLMAALAARDELTIEDPLVAARQLIAMTLGAAQLITTFRPRYPIDAELDEMIGGGVDTFLARYRASP